MRRWSSRQRARTAARSRRSTRQIDEPARARCASTRIGKEEFPVFRQSENRFAWPHTAFHDGPIRQGLPVQGLAALGTRQIPCGDRNRFLGRSVSASQHRNSCTRLSIFRSGATFLQGRRADWRAALLLKRKTANVKLNQSEQLIAKFSAGRQPLTRRTLSASKRFQARRTRRRIRVLVYAGDAKTTARRASARRGACGGSEEIRPGGESGPRADLKTFCDHLAQSNFRSR